MKKIRFLRNYPLGYVQQIFNGVWVQCVNDMAVACIHVMNLDREAYTKFTKPMLSHVNVGSRVDCTIRELGETLAKVTGFNGRIVFDTDRPDGKPRKLMDVDRLPSLGWKSTVSLFDGLGLTYSWYKKNIFLARVV